VHSFYRRWILANGSSEALGLGTTFLIGRAVAPWLASRSPVDTLLGAAAAVVLGTLLEGVVVGLAQDLQIGDPAALEIVVDVLTTDAVEIRTGAPVRIERWGGDATLAGHVIRVEPSAFTRLSALGVEEQRVNVIIGLDGPPAAYAALGDGYRVEVGIVVWEQAGRLLVPVGAVHRQGDGWAAYVVEAGRARLRSVRIGQRNGTDAEVLEGLREGERVVLYPTDNVEDGARVAQR
jgi:HlyD family secretion protein